MKTIYLVRHGRTRSNEEGRFQGWEDPSAQSSWTGAGPFPKKTSP